MSATISMSKQSFLTKLQVPKILFTAVLFIGFVLSVYNELGLTPQKPIERAFLNLNDLPGGWRVTEQTFHETGGEVSYHRRDAYVNVGRTVIQSQFLTVMKKP